MAAEAQTDEEARRTAASLWLAKATQDLQRVKRCMETPADSEDALFHCQQAAEKAVKAMLTLHDEPFRRTHDLGALGLQCAALEPALAELLARLDDLSEFAWIFRYPGEFTAPPEPDVRDAIELATAIVAAAAERIGPRGDSA